MRIQNESPQDAPLWCMDYFLLEATSILFLANLKGPELEALPTITDYQR